MNQQLDELEGNIDEEAITFEEVAPQVSFSDDEEDQGSIGGDWGEVDALKVWFSDDDNDEGQETDEW